MKLKHKSQTFNEKASVAAVLAALLCRVFLLVACPGDNAEQALIEPVDFKELNGKGKEEKK